MTYADGAGELTAKLLKLGLTYLRPVEGAKNDSEEKPQ